MTPEHERAKQWREAHGLSLDELADLTGYSTITIRWMEKGLRPPRPGTDDRNIAPWVMQRYRLVCAAVDQQLKSGQSFDWDW